MNIDSPTVSQKYFINKKLLNSGMVGIVLILNMVYWKKLCEICYDKNETVMLIQA